MRVWNADGTTAACLVDALALDKIQSAIARRRSGEEDRSGVEDRSDEESACKTDKSNVTERACPAHKACVISVVGGGGKTSLMYCLAREFSARGLRVILTTTTKVARQEIFPQARDVDEAVKLLAHGPVMAVRPLPEGRTTLPSEKNDDCSGSVRPLPEGKTTLPSEKNDDCDESAQSLPESTFSQTCTSRETDKCVGFSATELSELCAVADVLLVEADGARHLPLKAAAVHEPVIFPESDYVIAVAGVDGVGRPLGEVCHRPELAVERLEITMDTEVTPKHVFSLIMDEQIGQRKGVGRAQFRVLLNKADDRTRRETARAIAKELQKIGIHVAISALRDRIALIALGAGKSERFGGNKLVAELDGEPMYRRMLKATQHLVDAAGAPLLYKKILVTRLGQEQFAQEARECGFAVVFNPAPERGISSSIQLGISAAEGNISDADKAVDVDKAVNTDNPTDAGKAVDAVSTAKTDDEGSTVDAYLFTVCDQPGLSTETFSRLIEIYQYGGRPIAAVRAGDVCGNPNIFSVCLRDELMALTGDVGGRKVIARHPGDIVWVEIPQRELADVDHPEELMIGCNCSVQPEALAAEGVYPHKT